MLTRSNHLSLLCMLALGACAGVHTGNEDSMPDDSEETIDPVGEDTSHASPEFADTADDERLRPAAEVDEPVPEPAPDDSPVWTDSSARIQIAMRNYWLGGMKYERAVEDLGDEQLALLRGLERMASDPDDCIYDNLEATVTVHDADGSAETFELEHGICHYDGPLLTSATLKPFLRTTACLSRGAYGWSQGAHVIAADQTPVIGVNDGCTHGLHTDPPWIFIDVTDAAATHTLETLDCYGHDVQIDVFDETMQTPLAHSLAEAEGCSAVSYRFPAAGRYALRLVGTGSYSLRVTAE